MEFLALVNEDTTTFRNDGNYSQLDAMLTNQKIVRPQFITPLLDLEGVNDVSKMEIRLRRNDSRFPIFDSVDGTEI